MAACMAVIAWSMSSGQTSKAMQTDCDNMTCRMRNDLVQRHNLLFNAPHRNVSHVIIATQRLSAPRCVVQRPATQLNSTHTTTSPPRRAPHRRVPPRNATHTTCATPRRATPRNSTHANVAPRLFAAPFASAQRNATHTTHALPRHASQLRAAHRNVRHSRDSTPLDTTQRDSFLRTEMQRMLFTHRTATRRYASPLASTQRNACHCQNATHRTATRRDASPRNAMQNICSSATKRSVLYYASLRCNISPLDAMQTIIAIQRDSVPHHATCRSATQRSLSFHPFAFLGEENEAYHRY